MTDDRDCCDPVLRAAPTEEKRTKVAIEAAAAILEASGKYRILHRLVPRDSISSTFPDARLGIVLDCETTGLDTERDEVIEFARLKFAYSNDWIDGIVDAFSSFHEPSASISPEITALTRISICAPNLRPALANRIAFTSLKTSRCFANFRSKTRLREVTFYGDDGSFIRRNGNFSRQYGDAPKKHRSCCLAPAEPWALLQ